MELLTASRMSLLLSCPRRHYWRYECGLRRVESMDRQHATAVTQYLRERIQVVRRTLATELPVADRRPALEDLAAMLDEAARQVRGTMVGGQYPKGQE